MSARTDVVAVDDGDDAPIELQRAASACRLLLALYGDDCGFDFTLSTDGALSSVYVTPPPGGNQ